MYKNQSYQEVPNSVDLSSWLIVIPVRIGSTRLKNKPLVDICGKSMVVRVCENIVPLVKCGAKRIVATDSSEIAAECEKYQIEVQMTCSSHRSGTERCGEVARHFDYSYILNLQGDEPFIDCSQLIELMLRHQASAQGKVTTLIYKITEPGDIRDPNLVKVVTESSGKAIYFSRLPIPYCRQNGIPDFSFAHVGVYAFDRETLLRALRLPPSRLEQLEQLEQLRLLENGVSIYAVPVTNASLGIDTPKDLEQARKIYQQMVSE